MMSKTTGAKALPIWICAPSRADCMAQCTFGRIVHFLRHGLGAAFCGQQLFAQLAQLVCVLTEDWRQDGGTLAQQVDGVFVRDRTIDDGREGVFDVDAFRSQLRNAIFSFVPASVPSMPLLASTPNRAVVSSRLKPNSFMMGATLPIDPQTFRGPKHLPRKLLP